MNNKNKSKIIVKILNKTSKIPTLNYKNIFVFLSVLLSAQCTDVNVNNVTKEIYPKYNEGAFCKIRKKKIERRSKN